MRINISEKSDKDLTFLHRLKTDTGTKSNATAFRVAAAEFRKLKRRNDELLKQLEDYQTVAHRYENLAMAFERTITDVRHHVQVHRKLRKRPFKEENP